MMLQIFITAPWIFITIVGIFSLIVGSFLNVVIHRLPLMLEKSWRLECADFLNQTAEVDDPKIYNLALPGSQCPKCNAKIKLWHNIPVVSYILLRGKCAACETKIPARYLIVETLTLILSIFVAWQFGITWNCLTVLLLTWMLIALSFIDIEHQLLLDYLTLPLIWLGLIFSCFHLFTTPQDAIIGAIAGYLFFWLFAWLFKLAMKKDGLGQGDFKLIAAAGAWLGWQLLPLMIFMSCLLAVIIGGLYLIITRKTRETPIPFGPFLAIAFWLTMLWGNNIMQFYFRICGIHV
jgi:leader peptidase (prepilin peptidase) / N-methyltransferase